MPDTIIYGKNDKDAAFLSLSDKNTGQKTL